MSPRFRSAAFPIALAILTGTAIVVGSRVIVVGVQRMVETDRWVVHTHEVLQELQLLLLGLVDAETGERGFIITGDEQYLESYDSGRAAVQQHLARLSELTTNDPWRQQHLREIGPLVANELAHLEKSVRLRRARGFDQGRIVVLSGRSRRLMDEVRGTVEGMIADENALLQERARASAAAARHAIESTLVGSVASFALLAFSFEVARRRLRERAHAAARAHERRSASASR